MAIEIKIGILIVLSVISGVLGRMGGVGKPYKTWMRDWLCPLITLIALWLLFGFKSSRWWEYLLAYGLMGASLTTYWDWLFGYDNLWFSGFVTGLAIFPVLFTGIALLPFLLHAFILALTWGCLNKYLPEKVFIWRRDIAEEFLRYFTSSLTLLILLVR